MINQLNVLAGFGWKPLTSAQLDPEIRVWYWQLRNADIPLDAYQEIVDTMTSNRARAVNRGDKPPAMDAFNFIAAWRVIREERLRKNADRPLQLPRNAASECPRCFGTGAEEVYDSRGKKLGVKMGQICDHRPVDESETWLYDQIKRGLR